jgi:DNA-binding GntR family transcriptional regulator
MKRDKADLAAADVLALAGVRPHQARPAHRPGDNPLLAGGKHKSLTAAVYDSLKEDILSGVCPPGSKLRLVPLGQRYQVGNAAVREALSRLVSEGLVQAEDQRGFHVTPVSISNLKDITRVRIQIESEALRASIKHGDTEWEIKVLAALHRLNSTQPSDRNRDLPASQGRAEYHRQFHDALLAACDSPWLLYLQHLLYQHTERYRRLSIRYAEQASSKFATQINKQHEQLVRLALARDGEGAVALIADHLNATEQRILKVEAGQENSLLR